MNRELNALWTKIDPLTRYDRGTSSLSCWYFKNSN